MTLFLDASIAMKALSDQLGHHLLDDLLETSLQQPLFFVTNSDFEVFI